MKSFNIFIDENNFEENILKILKEIRSEWETKEIKFKIFSEGKTNKLIGTYCLSISEMILLRINGNKTESIIDRDAEIKNMIFLNKFGFAPKIYAKFSNGLCYEFTPGIVVTTEMIYESNIFKLIARKMAKMHKIELTEEQKKNEPMIISKTLEYLETIPERFSDDKKDFKVRQLLPSKQSLLTEFLFLQSVLKSCHSPIVFCHNDLNMVNIIYTADIENITFIDFEYAEPNYQAFDIANHFAKIAGCCDDSGIDYGKFPSKEFQKRWLKHYLREFHDRREIKNYEIENLQIIVSKFVLSSHFLWTCWCLIQAEYSTIEFDFIKMASIYYEEYLNRKRQFF